MSLRACIEAIHRGNLETLERLGGDAQVDEILATGRRIADATRVEQHRITERLDAAGIEAASVPVPALTTRHAISFEVADPTIAERAADLLAEDGFLRWERWEGGAQRSYHRHGDHLTVAKTADHTVVVRMVWGNTNAPSLPQRLFRPTSGDWDMLNLPRWAWRGYSLVRVVRLAAESLGRRRRHDGTLGPFLATPESLLEPALDFAAAGITDLVVDLGCGDGRLLVAAARRGGHASGIERSPDLARQAQERARRAGVADRVRVDVGDARDADLSDADVVFVFLPPEVLADLLPWILASMPAGGCVVAAKPTPSSAAR